MTDILQLAGKHYDSITAYSCISKLVKINTADIELHSRWLSRGTLSNKLFPLVSKICPQIMNHLFNLMWTHFSFPHSITYTLALALINASWITKLCFKLQFNLHFKDIRDVLMMCFTAKPYVLLNAHKLHYFPIGFSSYYLINYYIIIQANSNILTISNYLTNGLIIWTMASFTLEQMKEK